MFHHIRRETFFLILNNELGDYDLPVAGNLHLSLPTNKYPQEGKNRKTKIAFSNHMQTSTTKDVLYPLSPPRSPLSSFRSESIAT